jgi:large subunit ribosomal protein L16
MLQPKKLKFRKHHRGKMRGKATRGTRITFGQFGIRALEQGWIRARQIESGRRVLTRYVRRNGKLWICVYPDKPITFRAAESRMGAGKGTVEEYVAVVKTNKILYEITGLTKTRAKKALTIASHKMPIKTKVLLSV